MPLYEYECDACGNRFEHIQKFSDPIVEICPKCGGRVHKLMSSPAIQFKGSGWYITDYAKKDSTAAGKSDAAPATKDKTEKSETKASTDSSSPPPAPAASGDSTTKK
jgi:putative FmdB family regulatory protein